MTSNSDMPAMPVVAMEEITDKGGNYCGEHERTFIGLTKLEHFALLAPPMPSWFEMVFINDDALNKGVNYMQHNDESREMWVGEDGKPSMFMAWPVYYAKALLAELEKGNE